MSHSIYFGLKDLGVEAFDSRAPYLNHPAMSGFFLRLLAALLELRL